MSQQVYASPNEKIRPQPGINTLRIETDTIVAGDPIFIPMKPAITQVPNYTLTTSGLISPNTAGMYAISASLRFVDAFADIFDIGLKLYVSDVIIASTRLSTPESAVGDFIRTISATFFATPLDVIGIEITNYDAYPSSVFVTDTDTTITFQRIY